MMRHRLALIACVVLLVVAAAAPRVATQAQAPARDTGDYLYRFVIVQAAPGELLDLIDLYRARMPVVAAGGDELPFIVRHSQGDHWDLCIIYPSGSFTDYYGRERVAKRQAAGDASGVPNAEFARRYYSVVSWHEARRSTEQDEGNDPWGNVTWAWRDRSTSSEGLPQQRAHVVDARRPWISVGG